MYKLMLIESGEVIDRIQSSSLEQATYFFLHRKQMNEEAFNKIYKVEQEIEKTK